MRGLLSVVFSLLVIAVVYGIINLVVVGGQKVWNHEDEVKLDELKRELFDMEGSISGYEDLLTRIEAELESLEGAIDDYELDYPYGIPEEYYEDYVGMVADYKEWFSEYEDQYDEYISEIDYYNEKVDEANEIAEKVGSTWYVVPVPRR